MDSVVEFGAKLWPRCDEEVKAQQRSIITAQVRSLNDAVAQELGLAPRRIVWLIWPVPIPPVLSNRTDGETVLGSYGGDSIVLWLTRGWQRTAIHELVHAYTELTERGVEMMTTALCERFLDRRDLVGAERWL